VITLRDAFVRIYNLLLLVIRNMPAYGASRRSSGCGP
jgi:hypothetical protein